MTPLDAPSLVAFGSQHNIVIDVLKEVDSTSRWLQSAPPPALRICLAEKQTQGKGQQGKHWHSPAYDNIYFSCRYPFEKAPSELSGLSLAVAVILCRLLKELSHQPFQIKWPNDILFAQQKLAGILIECFKSPGGTFAIIGIGINVNMMPAEDRPIEQPWTSLQQIMGHPVARDPICRALIRTLPSGLACFQQEGLAPFLPDWRDADCLLGRTVQVRQGGTLLSGTATGVDESGRLLMRTSDGEQMAFHSGEAKLTMPHGKVK